MDGQIKMFEKYAKICAARVWLLVRWLILAGGTGVILGVIGGLFSRGIDMVTGYRNDHPWMLYLLPLAGLVIVALYKLDPYKTGTNRVLESIQSVSFMQLRTAPLIITSTILTHAFGGSAGREGAALQLGASISGTIGKWLRLDENDHKIMIMCGMSAGFAALFGTPLTATVFAMEVGSVGVMQYAALVPCAVAALAGKNVAKMVGAHAEHFVIPLDVYMSFKVALLTILLALLCAGVSILFCVILHRTEHLMKKHFPNEWIRVIVGGCMVILLAKVLGTTDYLGAGMHIIEHAIAGKVVASAFILKMIFTAITLGSGFRGGEIVPSLFIGATFGCLYGQLTGMDPALTAACGMISVFCGVTNCPISSLLLSFELFGFSCIPFFLLSVGVSYLESGYYGLYHSQKILYSKTTPEYIDRHTR